VTVFVVTGPPASGKSTWVRAHAKAGDITIDYDDLVHALSPDVSSDPTEQPSHVAMAAMCARDAAINEAVDTHGYCGPINHDVYVVHAMPDRHALNRYRKHGAQIITIDPGYDECIRRAGAERTPRQVAMVQDWYVRRGLAV
jgi:hypothetical protein